jgi:hypothetical protein
MGGVPCHGCAVASKPSDHQTMKTVTTITYIGGNTERKLSFFRSYTAKKPTYLGASRMVAARLNLDNDSCGEYPMMKPSDISVCRIEMCYYQTR